jgi:hypothetical protein
MRIIGRLLRLIQVLLPGLGGASVIGIKFALATKALAAA